MSLNVQNSSLTAAAVRQRKPTSKSHRGEGGQTKIECGKVIANVGIDLVFDGVDESGGDGEEGE